MQTTYTSVLARRIRIDGDFATLPYEAGWASEAVFFRRGRPVDMGVDDAIAEIPVTTFGNWLRLTVRGSTPETDSRILIHVNLKG